MSDFFDELQVPVNENEILFISGVVDFLKGIGWVKQNENGTYNITKKGKKNVITRHRPLVNLTK